DGSGGNMTTSDSACSKVDSMFVTKAEPKFIQFSDQGIALAAPEVPIDSRVKLLDYATKSNLFRVASFTSEEIKSAVQSGLLHHVDLLGINLDETVAALGITVIDQTPKSIIEEAVKTFAKINPKMLLSVTNGKDGSWSWDGSTLSYVPAFKVQIQNTAGAGDAHLAGLIVGITTGLSLHDAQYLATLTAGSSVESPHTINKETDRKSLRLIADHSQGSLNKNVYKLLED
ncbi:MAG: carbohydrate kinase family protein, partial [Candidatus Heimdallarchaeota archaeon]|nr:carbohydrate kinase family protein [Candidatus Heimdallarchaeota archaeon]